MAIQSSSTFQQRWLWELVKLRPDWRCMVTYTFRLRGELNADLLEQSVVEIVRRHESLRTAFDLIGGTLTPLIGEPSSHRLERIAITGGSNAEIDINARRWLEEFSNRRVDPLVGPLLSINLLRLSERHHWLVLTMHRLIGDCASIDQVFLELWNLYLRARQSPPPASTTKVSQYSAYAAMQQRMHDEWMKKHGAYWRQRLDGAAPVRWPTDMRANGVAIGALGRMNTHFGETLSAGLRNLAKRSRTLLANVMLAVYVAVLWRSCKQTDFILPLYVAGRQSEHRSVVGYFPYILYLRIELTGRESFSEILSCVGNEFFRALSHQDFGRIAMQEPELLSGGFFQWVTWHPDDTLKTAASSVRNSPELEVERVVIKDFSEDITALPPGMVAVEISFFDTASGIYASGVYRTDLFTSNTIEQFISDVRLASEEFVKDPDAKLTAGC